MAHSQPRSWGAYFTTAPSGAIAISPPFSADSVLGGLSFPGLRAGALEWGSLYAKEYNNWRGCIECALLCSVVLYDSLWKLDRNYRSARRLRKLRVEYEQLAATLTKVDQENNLTRDRTALKVAQEQVDWTLPLLAAAENALLRLYKRSKREWRRMSEPEFACALRLNLERGNNNLLKARHSDVSQMSLDDEMRLKLQVDLHLIETDIVSLPKQSGAGEWKAVLQQQVVKYILGPWLYERTHPGEWARRRPIASEPDLAQRFAVRVRKFGSPGANANEPVHDNEREQHRLKRKAAILGFI